MRYILLLICIGCANRGTRSLEINRIVSLAPNLTETVFFLNGGKKLVGVTTYCNYPEAAKEIEKVGDFSNASLERVIALKPDLVLVALPEQKRIKTELEKIGVKVFASHPHELLDIVNEIDSLARLLREPSPRESLLNLLKSTPKTKNKPRIYIELSENPIITIGRSSFLNDLLNRAGGQNIFSDISIEFPVVSWEEVLRRDPDIIIIFHPGSCSDRDGWSLLSAAKHKKVYTDLDQDIFLRPGPRVFKALQIVKSVISR